MNQGDNDCELINVSPLLGEFLIAEVTLNLQDYK